MRLATLLCAHVALGSTWEEQNAAGIAVTSVRVSRDAATWWTLDASKSDSGRLLLCAQEANPGKALDMEGVLYGSTDGGESWRSLFRHGTLTSEVSCRLGSGETIYFVDSTISPARPLLSEKAASEVERMYLRRSVDFGRSWSLSPTDQYLDSAALLVTPGRSENEDSLYLFAHGADGAYRTLTLSRDGGRTLGEGLRRLPPLNSARVPPANGLLEWLIGPPEAAMLPDGSYGFVVPDPEVPDPKGRVQQFITFTRVRADGSAVGAPSIVAEMVGARGGGRDRGGWRQPAIASDVTGRVGGKTFVVWSDQVDGREHILLAITRDMGRSWTGPRVIDDLNRRDGQQAEMPSIAINSAGIVAVMWGEEAGRCWRLSLTRDGGETFEASAALNDCSVPMGSYEQKLASYLDKDVSTIASSTGPRLRLSDARRYFVPNRLIGLAADQHSNFHAAWAAWGAEDDGLYVSLIKINSGSGIGSLQNASMTTMAPADAWVLIDDVAYQEATREFVVGATLVQRSTARRTWPATVRVASAHSPLGAVRAVGSDCRMEGEDAWVFRGPDTSNENAAIRETQSGVNGLDAASFSVQRKLHFRLVEPPRAGLSYHEKPLTVDADVMVGSTGLTEQASECWSQMKR